MDPAQIQQFLIDERLNPKRKPVHPSSAQSPEIPFIDRPWICLNRYFNIRLHCQQLTNPVNNPDKQKIRKNAGGPTADKY
jgi:hypothetical protein